MCGIFGLFIAPQSNISAHTLRKATKKMWQLSARRGKDASGVVCVLENKVIVGKLPLSGPVFQKTPLFGNILHQAIAEYQQGKPFNIAGHTRMVTQGSSEDQGNNQPFIQNEQILLHNGIIVNEATLWEEHSSLQRQRAVDTEIFAALLETSKKQGKSQKEAMKETFLQTRGANTIVALGKDDNSLWVSTMNNSLYYAHNTSAGITLFSSERVTLQKIIPLFPDVEKQNIVHLNSKEYLEIMLTTLPSEKIDREIVLASPHGVLKKNDACAFVAKNDWHAIEKLMLQPSAISDTLHRCKKCILPETFPFIYFNSEGICQYCVNYQPRLLKPINQLAQMAEKHRKPAGEANCLVPLSGGRDSCYGLHYMKKIAGFQPVAYTYDWGFVTDLARRNSSRMCEQLDVEHILVAADIKKKRNHVKKNIEAWLHRPQLGMIPLFMAGDKMFLYYDRVIRKEMNLDLTFFSAHWLEKTEFKTGFAKVNDTATHDSHHQLQIANQLKLFTYYARELVQNPRYINTSLIDTFAGYAAYFCRKAYHSVFDYIPWVQSEIEQTLIQTYGWETDPHAHSTWRIGDGTAPFYNYIYHRAAGFTEHDTFRSNQIRAGLISREQGLEWAQKDNLPQIGAFKWYCDTVDIDAIAALKIINRMDYQQCKE